MYQIQIPNKDIHRYLLCINPHTSLVSRPCPAFHRLGTRLPSHILTHIPSDTSPHPHTLTPTHPHPHTLTLTLSPTHPHPHTASQTLVSSSGIGSLGSGDLSSTHSVPRGYRGRYNPSSSTAPRMTADD